MPPASPAPVIGAQGVLLHVGPHKTGTSALQGGLAVSRQALLSHGVSVAGTTAEQHHAARAVTRHSSARGRKPIPDSAWTDLAGTVRRTAGRAVLSSELFDLARGRAITRIVDDLGPDRLHVAVTAVPFSSLLPSAWQQRIRSGHTVRLDDWLRETLAAHEQGELTRFWRRHRLDLLVARWAEAIGPDRVHLVIGNKERKRQLIESFEQLLGVPDQTIMTPAWSDNRSMRWNEAELVRRFHELAEELHWSPVTQTRFLRMGASRELTVGHRPGPQDPPITLPAWSQGEVQEIASTIVDGIARSGVHVMGELHSLLTPATPGDAEPEPATSISIDAAAHAVIGAARAGGAGILRESHVEREDLLKYPGVSSATSDLLTEELLQRGPEATSTLLSQLDSDQLLAELRRRASSRARRVVQRVRRRANSAAQ